MSLPLAKRGGVRQPVFLSKADRLSLTYRKTHSEVSDKAAQSASNQESRNLYTQVLVKFFQSRFQHPPPTLTNKNPWELNPDIDYLCQQERKQKPSQ